MKTTISELGKAAAKRIHALWGRIVVDSWERWLLSSCGLAA